MARKKQEAQELLAPDPFMEKATSGMNWLEKNLKVVLFGVVVVLGGVVAAQFVNSEGKREASVVTVALADAVESFSEATDLQTVLTATSADVLNKKYGEARDKLGDFRKKHGAHPSAAIAALYEGELARRMGDNGEAATLFEEYLSKSDPKAPLRFMALEGAGYAFEADKKHDEALARFEKLATAHPFYKDYALKHKARIQEKKGDKTGAIATYEVLVDLDDPRAVTEEGKEPEKTPLKSFAEERLRILK